MRTLLLWPLAWAFGWTFDEWMTEGATMRESSGERLAVMPAFEHLLLEALTDNEPKLERYDHPRENVLAYLAHFTEGKRHRVITLDRVMFNKAIGALRNVNMHCQTRRVALNADDSALQYGYCENWLACENSSSAVPVDDLPRRRDTPAARSIEGLIGAGLAMRDRREKR